LAFGGKWAKVPSVSSPTEFKKLPGLKVVVDEVSYEPDAETPPDRPHCFAYYITIRNDSETPVTIRGRKWVVTEAGGESVVLEGDGVVGKMPRIEPGESFSYNSYHLLDDQEAVAEGSYFGVDDSGGRVMVQIPKFRMSPPKPGSTSS
jgi:ApaG protein